MNYATVGQKIKTKHPEYSDLTDDQLGRMMIQKYPQYKDMAENTFEKIVDSDAIPVIGTIAGLGGGAILAPFTAGASLPFGGLAGYGGGKVIKESLQDILGTQSSTPQEQLGEAATGSATAMSLGEGMALLRGLINPYKSLEEIRTVSTGNKPVSQNTQEQATTSLKGNKSYQWADSDVQKIAEDRLNTFSSKVMPADKPTRLTEVYSELKPFEQSSRAYEGSDPFAQGTELASRAIRSIIKPQLPFAGRLATSTMSGMNKATPLVKKVAPWVAGGTGVYGLINYLLNKGKSSDQ